MRQFINIVLHLDEKAIRVPGRDGHMMTLLINPSVYEVQALCKRIDGGLRGLLVGDDLYLWDAYYGDHAFVAAHYNPTYKTDERLYIYEPGVPNRPLTLAINPNKLSHPRIEALLRGGKIVSYG